MERRRRAGGRGAAACGRPWFGPTITGAATAFGQPLPSAALVAAASSTARADGTESKAGVRDLRAESCRAYRRRRSEYHKRCKFCNDRRARVS